MNIMFMGTPDFALESLKALCDKGYHVTSVVTRSDKKQGREMKVVMPPVKEFALEKGMNVYQPESLKNGELKEVLDKENPVIESVDFDFSACGHALCIIDSGADHADLTDEYAAITK